MTKLEITNNDNWGLQDSLTKEEIRQADTATLRNHLAGALTLTAKTLTYLAFVWKELERRGEDLSDLRHGIAVYLDRIANGVLLAEVVVRYAGQSLLLEKMASLGIEEQRRLMQANEVKVAKITEGGGVVEESVPLRQLTAVTLRSVFAEGRVRPVSEQVVLVQNSAKKRIQRNRKDRSVITYRKITIDPDEKTLSVGRTTTPIDNILKALSDYYGVDVATAIELFQEKPK